MSLFEILLLGVALSLDSLAVSLSLGFVSHRTSRLEKVRFLAVIGLFHLVMIVVGCFLGENVSTLISHCDHWIAFALLAFLGVKMIKEGLEKEEESEACCKLLSLKNTFVLGFALSVDALIAGFSLGLVSIELMAGSRLMNLFLAGGMVGLLAATISLIGMLVGKRASAHMGSKAEIFGGVILILIGVKILFDHLMG